MAIIWELDFYSRPLVDENNKKTWEVLLCESPTQVGQDPTKLFRYAQFCPNQQVNSQWLGAAIAQAISEAPQPPQRIRFFRYAMGNMITKACDELGIPAQPSRRTYTLKTWLADRVQDFYPQQPGFQASALGGVMQYQPQTPQSLPDALLGQQWALVNLAAQEFQEMSEWEIGFGEAFPLEEIAPETQIPGILIFSPRATALAGWMSGLELGFLKFMDQPKPQLLLETGATDSWILAGINDPKTIKELQTFEIAKQKAEMVHFLGIQSNPEAQSFAGFWLLKETI
jgi:hypothetical protein